MQKIPTLFVRDEANRNLVTQAVTAGCDWVIAGEGFASRKLDGTCCMVRNGELWKRREQKAGERPTPRFEKVAFDPETGKTVGWVPVGMGPEDKWHREAMENLGKQAPDGTYELVGPKIQGNRERYATHQLIKHDDAQLAYLAAGTEPPRTWAGIKEWLEERDIEGLVFKHPDGRMAKIKRSDFGLKRLNEEIL